MTNDAEKLSGRRWRRGAPGRSTGVTYQKEVWQFDQGREQSRLLKKLHQQQELRATTTLLPTARRRWRRRLRRRTNHPTPGPPPLAAEYRPPECWRRGPGRWRRAGLWRRSARWWPGPGRAPETCGSQVWTERRGGGCMRGASTSVAWSMHRTLSRMGPARWSSRRGWVTVPGSSSLCLRSGSILLTRLLQLRPRNHH